jgi:hypothetical protein
MSDDQDLVLLFDVDNTLLDNDAVQEDLGEHLESEFGRAARDRYWAIFETLRSELGYADYLGALQRYRLGDPDDPQLLRMSGFLIDYPFTSRLYPGALKTLAHCRRLGQTAILSDGDVVRVMIYLHKEQMLDAVERRYPAKRYVMVDDKLRILTAMKQSWGERLTTIFVRQGHYALDLANISAYPAADRTIERIGDLAGLTSANLSEVK